MDKIKLKPCPFCGSEKLLFVNCEYKQTLWTIRCHDCEMEMSVARKRERHGGVFDGKFLSNHDDVVKVWNIRENDREIKN